MNSIFANGDTIKIRVPACRDKKVRIYEPSPSFGVSTRNWESRYMVPIYPKFIPEELSDVLHLSRPGKGVPLHWAKSFSPPPITWSDSEGVVNSLQVLDASNKPRDAIFEKRNMVVTCSIRALNDRALEFYDQFYNGRSKVQFSLVLMAVDMTTIAHPGREPRGDGEWFTLT